MVQLQIRFCEIKPCNFLFC